MFRFFGVGAPVFSRCLNAFRLCLTTALHVHRNIHPQIIAGTARP